MEIKDIQPEAWYYAMYDIDNDGNRINKVTALQGKDLTENQIKTCEPIS